MGVNPQRALAVDQDTAAELLDVSVATLRRWRRRQQGPRAVRIGRLIRYTVAELERFLRRAEPAGIEAPEVGALIHQELVQSLRPFVRDAEPPVDANPTAVDAVPRVPATAR